MRVTYSSVFDKEHKMSLIQIPAPNLGVVGATGSAIYLMEAAGFSPDGGTLLVKVTFAGDSPEQQRHAIWLFDVATRTYTTCLNASLTVLGLAVGDIDVSSAQMVGLGTQAVTLVQYSIASSSDVSYLAAIRGGTVIDVWSQLSLDNPLSVERYAVSPDGRFLAVQTQDSTLAPINDPDTNDTSDIYLVDLKTLKTDRVSMVSGAQVDFAVNLGNVLVTDTQVKVTFSTSAKFATKDTNENSIAPVDAYQWSRTFDATGLTGQAALSLISTEVGATGAAAGGVSTSAALFGTNSGVWFESTSDAVVEGDANAASDIFFKANATGLTQKLVLSGVPSLANAPQLVSVSADGNFAAVLVNSPEVLAPNSTAPLVPQILVWQRTSQKWRIVSQGEAGLADQDVLSGQMSPQAQWVAFTSIATNLTTAESASLGGQLYLASLAGTFNQSPTGTVEISGLAKQGQTLKATNTLADADGLGAFSYKWKADGVDISGAASSSFTLTKDQVGKKVSVAISYTDLLGSDEIAVSNLSSLVASAPTLSGQIYHWKTHALMKDVSVGIDSLSISSKSNAAGAYTLNSIEAQSIKLAASLPQTSLETGSRVINSLDALAALKISVGLNPNLDGSPVSPYQLIAADVNRDGKVNSLDALAILKMAVGRSDAPAREWLFVSESQDFWDETANNGQGGYTVSRTNVTWNKDLQTSVSQDTTVNLLAVLKGDVNGTWTGPNTDVQILPNSYFVDLVKKGFGPLSTWAVITA